MHPTRRTSRAARSRRWLAPVLLVVAACSSTSAAPTDEPRAPVATPAVARLPPLATSPLTTATTTPPPTSPTASSTLGPAAPTTPSTVGPEPEPTVPASTAILETAAAPEVDAAAYAVFDASSGVWLDEHDADTQRPVASLMKLLTARVVLQAGEPERIVTVPAMELDPLESVIGLYEGEQLRRDVLFRAMMIRSANDAARALAHDISGGDEAAFVAQMNTAAAGLGLTGTNAVNPVGLDADGAGSTAHDLVTLTAELLGDPAFSGAVAQRTATLHGQTWQNTNELLTTYPDAIGVKTGSTTAAGACVVAAAERDGRTIIVVVLGASDRDARFDSATALLDWAFAQP